MPPTRGGAGAAPRTPLGIAISDPGWTTLTWPEPGARIRQVIYDGAVRRIHGYRLGDAPNARSNHGQQLLLAVRFDLRAQIP